MIVVGLVVTSQNKNPWWKWVWKARVSITSLQKEIEGSSK
jgi:hypothetical protein